MGIISFHFYFEDLTADNPSPDAVRYVSIIPQQFLKSLV